MKKLCYLLVLLAVFPAVLFAQTFVASGIIRGGVRDASGAVVPGANVVLFAPSTGATLTRISNSVGLFVFPSQPVGLYTLEATAAGFQKERVEGVNVQVGQTTNVSLRLRPGVGSESITVSGESPLLRTEDSDQSSVVNREQLDSLPLSGRRFLDFALLAPNVTADGQQGLVSFAGEQGGEDSGYANANGANSFSVDGASATSNYFGAAASACRTSLGKTQLRNFKWLSHRTGQNMAVPPRAL